MEHDWIGLHVGGPENAIDARALADGSAALVRLLEKSAANLSEKNSRDNLPKWVVGELAIGSLDIKLIPASAFNEKGAAAISLLIEGIQVLDKDPIMPPQWDRGMLLDVQRLGGLDEYLGVEGVRIDGPRIDSIHLEESVLKNVQSILDRSLTSHGSVTGQVISWRIARGVDHVEIQDETTGEKVDVEIIHISIADARELIRERVRASGLVKRNLDGIKLSVAATDVEVLNKRPRVSILDVRGVLGSDWTDGVDPVTWQRRLRDIG